MRFQNLIVYVHYSAYNGRERLILDTSRRGHALVITTYPPCG